MSFYISRPCRLTKKEKAWSGEIPLQLKTSLSQLKYSDSKDEYKCVNVELIYFTKKLPGPM